MIITVTLNPAIDQTVEILNFKVGDVNKTIKKRKDIGGKGINVSKGLKSLGTNSLALGFLGGVYKKEFKEKLKELNIKELLTSIESETRTNIKIVDPIRKKYTDVNDKGPNISKSEKADFLKTFKTTIKDKDIVVISGSLPKNIEENFYKILISIAKEKGAFVIFDAEGKALKEGLKSLPHIIKPNIDELEGLAHRKFKSDSEIINYCQSLIKLGIKKIMVSLGEKGSIFIGEDKVYKIDSEKVDVLSTVGAGDAMVAATAYGVMKNLDNKEILCLAQAMGVASVIREGTLPPKREDINKHLKIARNNIKEIRFN